MTLDFEVRRNRMSVAQLCTHKRQIEAFGEEKHIDRQRQMFGIELEVGDDDVS